MKAGRKNQEGAFGTLEFVCKPLNMFQIHLLTSLNVHNFFILEKIFQDNFFRCFRCFFFIVTAL